tara:strand:- start:43 stop:414 length:372 start_codon:yes stop_codon:yes gene_type:complete
MELLKQFKLSNTRGDISFPNSEVTPDKYIFGLENLDLLNERSLKANFNRALYVDRIVERICEDRKCETQDLDSMNFPIIFSMIHNDTEVRVVFSWGKGNAQLDMSFKDYDELPKISDLTSIED